MEEGRRMRMCLSRFGRMRAASRVHQSRRKQSHGGRRRQDSSDIWRAAQDSHVSGDGCRPEQRLRRLIGGTGSSQVGRCSALDQARGMGWLGVEVEGRATQEAKEGMGAEAAAAAAGRR